MTTNASSTSSFWLDVLEPRLVDKTTIPHLNSPELFSMKEMASRLGGVFRLSGGELTLGTPQIEGQEEKTSRVHDSQDPHTHPTISYGYRIGVLPGVLYWLIDRNEAERLITLLLKGKQELAPELDPDLVDAFMRYFSLEILLHLRALGFHDDLLVECIGSLSPSPEGKYIRIPLNWNVQGTLFASSLILPEAFTQHWNHHFQQEHERKPLSDTRAEAVSVILHLDVGTITVQQKEWEATQIGDFLLFDHCTLIPGKDKGRVRITAGNIPLFRAMVKEGTIKLLEHSVYQEMEPSMSNKPSDNLPTQPTQEEEPEESEESEESEELEDENSEEWEEEEESEDELSEIEDEELNEEEPSEIEEEQEEEKKEEVPPPKKEAKQVEKTAKTATSTNLQTPKSETSEPPESLTSIQNIPFTLSVEVGRIKMSLAQLRKLEPGQVLDLSIDPEHGVDLVVEGRTIGRGELLRLGESVGVRVTQLG